MAIQVNGTTVIDNSRNLTNIASVDATTVAAFSASGVGGATKLITQDAALTGGSTYSFSLTSRYSAYFLLIQDIRHTHSDKCDVRARFTDTSNNAITSGYQSWTNSGGYPSATTQNEFILQTEVYQTPSSYEGRADIALWIYNAHISTRPTYLIGNCLNRYFTTTTLHKGTNFTGARSTSEINNSIFLFPVITSSGATTSTWASGGRYSMWGVDL